MRSNYLKLGFLVSFFVLASLFFLAWISGNPFEKKRHYFFLFKNVQGISIGSKVRYSGLPCGKVIGFTLPKNQAKGVLVKAEITNPEIKIYQSDLAYSIPNSTIAAEYEISIKPNRLATNRELLKEGETLIGGAPLSLDQASEEATNLLEKIRTATEQIEEMSVKANQYISSIEPIFKEIQDLGQSRKITKLVNKLNSTTNNLDSLSKELRIFWSENQIEVSSTIKEVNTITKKINQKIDLLEDRQIKSILNNFEQSSSNINKLTGSIRPKDLEKLRKATDQVNLILTKIQSDDPNKDVPTLILKTSQNAFYITEQLERNLRRVQGKTVLGSLFTKVN